MGLFDGKKTKIETCSTCDGSGYYHIGTSSNDDEWDQACGTCGGYTQHGTFSTKEYMGSGKVKVIYDKDGKVISKSPYGSSRGLLSKR